MFDNSVVSLLRSALHRSVKFNWLLIIKKEVEQVESHPSLASKKSSQAILNIGFFLLQFVVRVMIKSSSKSTVLCSRPHCDRSVLNKIDVWAISLQRFHQLTLEACDTKVLKWQSFLERDADWFLCNGMWLWSPESLWKFWSPIAYLHGRWKPSIPLLLIFKEVFLKSCPWSVLFLSLLVEWLFSTDG